MSWNRTSGSAVTMAEPEEMSLPSGCRTAEPSKARYLAIENLSYAINLRPVIKGLSLDIREGEFFTLLGPSGCGKTTLLRLIAGFETPDSGSLSLDGTSFQRTPAARRPVNTVFQNYALFPHLDVAGNVAFGLRMLNWPRDRIAGRVEEMLKLVRLSDLRHRHIGELSGGQQQRVALARALAPVPKVLLLDEPFSALDLKLRQEMQAELKRIQTALRQTVVFVTHDQEEALSLSDRIAIMRDGEILRCDTPEALYARPADRFVAGFLGDANFIAGRLLSLDASGASVEFPEGQRAIIRPGAHIPAPGRVCIMFRPEDVLPGHGAGLDLTANVAQKTFLGPDLCLHLDLQDGTRVKLRHRARAELDAVRPGQRIAISVPLAHLHIVRDTDR